jgi:uncharacterized protein
MLDLNAMIPQVTQKQRELADLCRRFEVERLDLFGSAADGNFQSNKSDLDFLVRFANPEPTGDYADRFLNLAEAMERLFQRPIDLVTEQSVRNPYFRRVVDASRQPVYERQDTQTVV